MGASTAEQRALRVAIDEGRVGENAPINHLNGAMAEELGWAQALDDGQLAIQGPGKVTATGPDYITYDPTTRQIVVWDAKYSVNGNFPSGGIPADKLQAWSSAITDAVNNYSGPSALMIKQALTDGKVTGKYFTYP